MLPLFLRIVAQQAAIPHDGYQGEDPKEQPHYQKDYKEFGHTPPSRIYCRTTPGHRSVTALTLEC